MRIEVTILGAKPVEIRLEATAARAARLQTPLRQIDGVIRLAGRKTFDSQGRYGGGQWKPPSTQWQRYKKRHRLDKRTMHATRRLRKSVVNSSSADRDLQVTADSMTVYNRVPYARKRGKINPLLKTTPGDRILMRRILIDWVMGR